MNKLLAKAFSVILTMCHVFVVVAVVVSPTIDYDPTKSFMIKTLFLIGYVVIAGAIATLVSINEYLSDISKKLDAQK